MTDRDTTPAADEHTQIKQRREKLHAMRAAGFKYPNHFRPSMTAASIAEQYEAFDADALQEKSVSVQVAGRLMTRRIMGKASFMTIQDQAARIQIYLSRDELPDGVYASFKQWDLGDIVGVTGRLFRTKTGELSVRASEVILLTKALRPLPDKYHGLADHEQRARMRYLDLIANPASRRLFATRSNLISALRTYLNQHDFMEVETPMMHALIGGASAKPFCTHHNALDLPLYMRIAPELYLKRLVVGGFNRVYELNRNFRNEGLSTRHNPEFTMVEFYQAYADFNDLMDLTEDMLRTLAHDVLGSTAIHYQGHDIDLTQSFKRLPLVDAIVQYGDGITKAQCQDLSSIKKLATQHNIDVPENWGVGKIQMELFEAVAERQLQQPTFITQFPAEVSPLARLNDDDPFITDRFELYVGGQEIANGFSELNDSEDQAERFSAQIAAREAGDEEAMSYDADYIKALEHGLPPTAGEGIGIDRLVMLFTDTPSIRDVILFPLLRPKQDD